MKKIVVLFIFSLLGFTVHSQTLSETDFIGTWLVVNILDEGTQPNQAKEMLAAYFDLGSDYSFQLRTKKHSKDLQEYENKLKNYTWSFDDASQTIKHTNDKFNTIDTELEVEIEIQE